MARRYPLEPLVAVRGQKVDRRSAELGAAKATRTREQAAAKRARDRHDESRKTALTARAAERELLERGALTARDLAQGDLHRLGVDARLQALAGEEAAAERRSRRARTALVEADVALGRARADHEATLRHHGRFRAEEARAAERTAEDALADHFLSSRRGARRG